jgi:hypothetical protein
MAQWPSSSPAPYDHGEEEEEEEVNPDLFTLPGPSNRPCKFYFHTSLTPAQRTLLAPLVTTHGGHITATESHADIIVVYQSKLNVDIEIMRMKYDRDPELRQRKRAVWVESLAWVQRCARMGEFKLRGRGIKKGMPGPRPRSEGGRVRVNFADDEDERLCQYIAITIPTKRAGGRTGNQIYKELETLVRPSSPFLFPC